MILASGELNLFVVVVMAVIGLINWLVEKSKSGGGPTPPRDAAGQGGPRRPPANSEEERMRRFLEALGIPPDSAPPPVRRPQPKAPAAPPPIPLPVRPKKERRPAASPLPARPRIQALDEAPAPHFSVGQIELPELAVPVVSDFETTTSKIAAIPMQRAEALQTAPSGGSLGEWIRRELHTPQQVRAAFVLREILGPPRGLQSY